MPNFGYHLARAEGRLIRKIYAALLPAIVRRPIKARRNLLFDVYAYSGESALPEQVASIRSFLRHAGRPQKYAVVSDGTYSARSVALLHAIDSAVSVVHFAEQVPANVPDRMRPYLNQDPMGRKVALIMSLPLKNPAFYVDSDVLFFPGAEALRSLDTSLVYYLPDCQLSADERLFRDQQERTNPVNAGVLFLSRNLDWSMSFERFLEMGGPPVFFTDQTMTHLTMQANGAKPFEPQKFILQLDDQFIYPDRYASRDIVLRHYVNPVRHKFWTTVGRPR